MAGADDGFDAHEKPFLDHLEDLRHTLLKIAITLVVSTALCFAFHQQIFHFMQMPAKLPLANIGEGVTLWDRLDFITLTPPELIIQTVKVSFFTAVIISFPFTVFFLFQFIIPGLRQVEKRAIIPGVLAGFMLFLVGVGFAFFLATPLALKFFYEFENKTLSNSDPSGAASSKKIANITLVGVDGNPIPPASDTPSNDTAQGEEKSDATSLTPALKEEIREYMKGSFATLQASNFAIQYDDSRDKLVIVESKGGRSQYRIGEYISFVSRLMLVFGACFQMPIIVTILVKLDLLTARVMRSTRSYAIVIILVIAAVLTPPDIFTLLLLGGPMIILYEICILIASFLESRREKRELAEEEARRTRLENLYSRPASDLSEEEKQELHRAEIEQYEKEHAHLYSEENEHEDTSSDTSETVSRDHLHGNIHDYDESWQEDQYYGGGNHVIDSDHAEPEDLTPGSDTPETSDNHGPEFEDHDVCQPDGPVIDLNHASKEELMTLPGMDPELADALIQQRRFETFDDVDLVPGMTPARLAKMIDRLMLG